MGSSSSGTPRNCKARLRDSSTGESGRRARKLKPRKRAQPAKAVQQLLELGLAERGEHVSPAVLSGAKDGEQARRGASAPRSAARCRPQRPSTSSFSLAPGIAMAGPLGAYPSGPQNGRAPSLTPTRPPPAPPSAPSPLIRDASGSRLHPDTIPTHTPSRAALEARDSSGPGAPTIVRRGWVSVKEDGLRAWMWSKKWLVLREHSLCIYKNEVRRFASPRSAASHRRPRRRRTRAPR